MSVQDEFVKWATSPERTLEEAYCAERLVEQGLESWRLRHAPKNRISFDVQQATANRRRLNPAHRVRISEKDARQGCEGLLESDRLHFSAWKDRPLRDLSGLRFFPHLKHLSLCHTEAPDFSPLEALPALEHLFFNDDVVEDLTPLGSLKSLRELYARVRVPWPKVAAMAGMENLEELHWAGNLLALEEIPRLSRVRQAEFSHGFMADLPPRDCSRLPEMPWLEVLKLERVCRLDGITRWPRLKNLIIGGPFKDLHPLTGLRQLTHLELPGDVTRDLSPLVQLTQLRRLKVQGSHPQDYSVLAEAPRLHEVVADGCKINQMELSTLHAVLPKWDEEFEAEKPRVPGPLEFKVMPHQQQPQNPRAALGAEASWDGDAAMGGSEHGWMQRRVSRALARLIPGKGWGQVNAWAGLGVISVRLQSMDAAERLADVVEKIRAVLASARWPWQAHLTVCLDEPMEDEDDEEMSPEEEARIELENTRDYQRRRKEEEEYLEREHRLRLQQQEGKAVNPAEFAPPEGTAAVALQDMDAAEDEPEDYAVEERGHPLADELFVTGMITLDGFYVDEKFRRAAEHLMRCKME